MIELNDYRDESLDMLDIKMQQSLDSLNSIRALLNSKPSKQSLQNQRLKELEQDWILVKTELASKQTQLDETKKNLQLAQNDCNGLQQTLDDLNSTHDTQSNLWEDQYTQYEKSLQAYKHEINELKGENKTLEEMISQLQDLYQKETHRKEQVELLLKENVEELELTTAGIRERDQKIEEFQKHSKYMHQMMDEKDEILDSCDAETQLRIEEYDKLQDKYNTLEEENQRIKRRLSNLNELYHNPETHSRKSTSLIEDQRLFSEVDNKRSSRIPIPSVSNRSTNSAANHYEYIEEMDLLKQKLMEKVSQNKELESAMERVNEHAGILRISLNESREESADRYRKMLGYMEEIRILKQELDYVKNASI